MALVDAQAKQIRGQMKLTGAPISVAVDDRAVYLLDAGDAPIRVLSHDLTEVRQVRPERPVERIFAPEDDRLFAIESQRRASPERVIPECFVQIDPPAPTAVAMAAEDRALVESLFGVWDAPLRLRDDAGFHWLEDDLFLLGDSVWDAALSQRQILLYASGVANILDRERNVPLGYIPSLTPWRIESRSESARNTHISAAAPLRLMLDRTTGPESGSQRWSLIFRTFEGREQDSLFLTKRFDSGFVQPLLDSSGKQVFAAIGNELIFASLPERSAAGLPEPFRIRPTQPAVVVAADQVTPLPLQLAGGTAPYQLSLSFNQQGVTVDPASQSVVVDGAAIAEFLSEKIVAAIMQNGHALAEERLGALDLYREAAAPSFAQLAGRPPEGIPLAIGVGVTARDAKRASAHLAWEVLIELPREGIAASVATKVEEAQRLEQASQTRAAEDQRRPEDRPPAEQAPTPAQPWPLPILTGVSAMSLAGVVAVLLAVWWMLRVMATRKPEAQAVSRSQVVSQHPASSREVGRFALLGAAVFALGLIVSGVMAMFPGKSTPLEMFVLGLTFTTLFWAFTLMLLVPSIRGSGRNVSVLPEGLQIGEKGKTRTVRFEEIVQATEAIGWFSLLKPLTYYHTLTLQLKDGAKIRLAEGAQALFDELRQHIIGGLCEWVVPRWANELRSGAKLDFGPLRWTAKGITKATGAGGLGRYLRSGAPPNLPGLIPWSTLRGVHLNSVGNVVLESSAGETDIGKTLDLVPNWFLLSALAAAMQPQQPARDADLGAIRLDE
jgi:hypothetical protein